MNGGMAATIRDIPAAEGSKEVGVEVDRGGLGRWVWWNSGRGCGVGFACGVRRDTCW